MARPPFLGSDGPPFFWVRTPWPTLPPAAAARGLPAHPVARAPFGRPFWPSHHAPARAQPSGARGFRLLQKSLRLFVRRSVWWAVDARAGVELATPPPPGPPRRELAPNSNVAAGRALEVADRCVQLPPRSGTQPPRSSLASRPSRHSPERHAALAAGSGNAAAQSGRAADCRDDAAATPASQRCRARASSRPPKTGGSSRASSTAATGEERRSIPRLRDALGACALQAVCVRDAARCSPRDRERVERRL